MKANESAEIVKAVGALTKTVSGKVKQIDDKVSTVASDIYDRMNVDKNVTFFIDVEKGSDGGTGTEKSPFKTVAQALRAAQGVAVLTIRLQYSQRHKLGWTAYSNISTIEFLPWKENSDTTRPYHFDEHTPILEIDSAFRTHGSLIFGNYRKSLIIEATSSDPNDVFQLWGGGSVIVARSRIVLGMDANTSLFGGTHLYLSPNKLSLREVDIVRQGGYLGRPCHFIVQGSSGFEFVEDVIKGATPKNTMTNVKFKES